MSSPPSSLVDHADLSNWRSPPHSAWAFQHVRDIVACAPIDADPAGAQPLLHDPRSLAAFRLGPGGGARDLERFLADTQTDGLVALVDGKIAYESYAHGMTADTPHIVMSVSKLIVGLVTGILVGRGQLDPDAEVTDLVPEIAQTAYRGATLRHLLDMRTGVVLDEHALRAYNAATGWEPAAADAPGADLHAFFATTTATATPHGGPFRYVSANTDLLGWAIERATGQRFAVLASDLLWKPMGAEHPASITVDRRGAPRCTGGLSMTLRDLARMGQLIVQGGRRGDRAIVPASWLDDVASHGDAQAWNDGEFAAAFRGRAMRYRSGWYVIDDEPRMVFAMGIHGQHLFVDRASRLVIAKLSSQGPALDHRALALTHQALPELRRCLLAPR